MRLNHKIKLLLLPGLLAFVVFAAWISHRDAMIAELELKSIYLAEVRLEVLALGLEAVKYGLAARPLSSDYPAKSELFETRLKAIKEKTARAKLREKLEVQVTRIIEQTGYMLNVKINPVMGIKEETQLLISLINKFNLDANNENVRLEKIKVQAHSKFDHGTALIFVLGIMLLIFTFLAGSVVLRPFKRALEVIKKIAAGDLSQRFQGTPDDDIGELSLSVNTITQTLTENKNKINEIAATDALTGLLNVGEFRNRLAEELARSKRYNRQCALVLVEIDQFKTLNDEYGQPAGDEVLRVVAQRIKNNIRPNDHPARCGPDELAVIMTEITLAGVVIVAERLRQSIESKPVLITPEKAVNVTISVGIALYPEHAAAEARLITEARNAMAEARRLGRNCISTPALNEATAA